MEKLLRYKKLLIRRCCNLPYQENNPAKVSELIYNIAIDGDTFSKQPFNSSEKFVAKVFGKD